MDLQATLTGDLVEPHRHAETVRDAFEVNDGDVNAIAEDLDCGASTVRNYLRQHGITDSSTTRPYFVAREDGYECWKVDGRTIYIHRLLAVAEFGFEEVASGVVHHRNHHRWDNRPENLQVFNDNRAHRREHTRPKPTDDQGSLAEYPTTDELRTIGNGRDENQLTFDDF